MLMREVRMMAPSQSVEFGNLGRRPPQRKELATSGEASFSLFKRLLRDLLKPYKFPNLTHPNQTFTAPSI